jgi:murein L,D-transpeptidase YcbB/YkuD
MLRMFPVFAPMIMAALLNGCSADEALEVADTETTDAATPVDEDVRALKNRVRVDFSSLYEMALQRGVGNAVRNLLLHEEPPIRLRRQRFLYSLYADREFEPVFIRDGGVSERYAPAIDALRQAGAHALPASRFYDEVLLTTLDRYAEFEALAQRTPVSLTSDEIDTVLDLIDNSGLESSQTPGLDLMGILADPERSPLNDLAQRFASDLESERLRAGASALAESLIADRVLDYAFEQRHFNVSMVDEEFTEDERDLMIAERMTATFTALAESTSEQETLAIMEALPPALPQYPLLLSELTRYRQIVADGGWQEVPRSSIRRGSQGERVSALQRRLAAEGYFTGEVDGIFDAEVLAAVNAYKTTHQMDADDELDRSFWGSLNVPAEDRLAQIELTIQRWRESRIGDDEYYVFINIPDFHAELWRNGERQMRFRIVVGNTARVCDPATQTFRYANATPMQSAEMSYLVMNPYWNIPRRILSEELLPNLLEDNEYFDSHGIEQVQNENGSISVRQRPGPENPLGRVKFIFPNPHDTYMHDTSRPHYFRFPVRAFSHGCMRVQDPLNFLETVLTNDGQWDQNAVQRIFDSGVETSRRLTTPIPVHIEYYVVRVDDEGRANFNSDVYRYDRDRLSPPDPGSLRCTPDASRPEFRLVLDEEGNPMVRDAEGNLIDPSAAPEPEPEEGPAAGDIGP